MSQQANILLVDESVEFHDVVTYCLARRGFEVQAVQDSENALQVLSKNPGALDILITDLETAQQDGWNLPRQAKQISPDLKVLLMMGRWPDLESVESLAVTEKPFRLTELVFRLQLLLC